MNPINATHPYAGHHAEAAYSRWAPVYDLIFDLPFHPGRAAAARAAGEAAGPGGEILVIGVGTGLELPLLPGNVLAQEVVAESWPNETLVEACVECVDSWRQSPGHWSAVRSRHPLFGYDIKRGRNGIWYATGIFGLRRR